MNRRLHGSSGDFGIDTTVYYKKSLINKAGTFIIMMIGVAMLVVPLWWLQKPPDQLSLEARFAIISGFLVAATIVLSVLTFGRTLEILAGTAVYAAILAIFMQVNT